MTQEHQIAIRHLVLYGMLAMPVAFAGMPLYVHAPDYYTTQLSIPLSSIAVALLVLRFIDAIQDPIIGRLSDYYASKRYSIMVVSALVLALSFYALFQPWGSNHLIWFVISMFLATTAFSILSINLNTFGGLWSKDSYQKTRIAGCREGFGIIGLFLAILLPSIAMQYMEPSKAFLLVSLVLACLILISLIAFSLWHKDYAFDHTERNHRYESFWQTISHMHANLRRFFCVYAVSMLASAIPAILVIFFIRDRLGAEAYTGLFLFVYFLSGVVGIPLWQAISKKRGKFTSWMIAMLVAIASFIWAFFLETGDLWQYGIICVASGIAFGAELVIPPSILADFVDKEHLRQKASLYFGLFAFLAKAALAVGSVVTFPLLDAVNFQPGLENDADALLTLSFTYAVIPCALKLISAFMLWRSKSLLQLGDDHAQETVTIIHGSNHHA